MSFWHPGTRKFDALDWLLFFLAAATLPMLWFEYAVGVSDAWRTSFRFYFLFLWAVFALELAVHFLRAPDKALFLKRHWIQVVIVFFPALRLVRLFRSAELAFIIFADRFSERLSFFRLNRFVNLIVLMVLIVSLTSELILLVERNYADSDIKTFGDAVWWSTVGISTLGIGNLVPVSVAGKALNLVLAFSGILLFSVITAQFTDLFISDERIQHMLAVEKQQLLQNIKRDRADILEKLDRLEQVLLLRRAERKQRAARKTRSRRRIV